MYMLLNARCIDCMSLLTDQMREIQSRKECSRDSTNDEQKQDSCKDTGHTKTGTNYLE